MKDDFFKTHRRPASELPEGKRAEQLAERLGVEIPGHIREALWSLPLLESIVARIEELERREAA